MANLQKTYKFDANDILTLPRDAYIRIGADSGADVTLQATITSQSTVAGNDTDSSIPSVSGTYYTIDTVTAGEQKTSLTKLGAGTKIKVTGGSAEVELLDY